jgi:hypothetical protein
MISKKTDIFIYKKAAPFEVFPYRREEGGDPGLAEITEIYCNYGQIIPTYDLEDSRIIISSTGRDLLDVEEDSKIDLNNNVFPYEEGKFLVITMPLIFERYKNGSIKSSFLGIGKESKINWKEKNKIIPASFSLQEIRGKVKPVNFADAVAIAKNSEDAACEYVFYEVDLVLYAEDIQYFKGNIDYTVDIFNIGDIREDFPEIDECEDPIEQFREQGFIIKDPNIYYHISFYST